MATTQPDATGVRAEDLRRLLDGRYADLRRQILDVLGQPEFAPPLAIPTAEYRERVLAWMQTIADEGLTAPGFPAEFGGQGDPGANIAGFETIAFGDLSLLVKFGVQFGLWGGAIQQLGTRVHHERYLRPTASLELTGCFAMTETGHGSNVQQLGTTATYDPDGGEFVIDTPTDEARKDYIGNAACHARMAAVFAQLIVAGESHGVHVLVVPIRDENGNVHEGVRIEDCGEKMGLNGVDNGRIWFDRVRVPRDALLNRYGGVNAEGVYESPIENPNKRFFTMLGAMIQGRVCISGASISAAKTALTIAVRYGLRRTQFGPPDEPEVALLDYRTHQRRLMPLQAKTYALHFAQAELLESFHERQTTGESPEREQRRLESLAAAMKATASWHATETIQSARESPTPSPAATRPATCSNESTNSSCSAGGRATSPPRSPNGSSVVWTTASTRSRCSARFRTTPSPRPAPTSSSLCSRRSRGRSTPATRAPGGRAGPALRPSRTPPDRARPGLPPGARPAHRTTLQGGDARGQPAVRRGAR